MRLFDHGEFGEIDHFFVTAHLPQYSDSVRVQFQGRVERTDVRVVFGQLFHVCAVVGLQVMRPDRPCDRLVDVAQVGPKLSRSPYALPRHRTEFRPHAQVSVLRPNSFEARGRSQAGVTFQVEAIQFERTLVHFPRLFDPNLFPEPRSIIRQRLRVVGVEIDGEGPGGAGFLYQAARPVVLTQGVLHLGQVRRERQGPEYRRFRRLQVTLVRSAPASRLCARADSGSASVASR